MFYASISEKLLWAFFKKKVTVWCWARSRKWTSLFWRKSLEIPSIHCISTSPKGHVLYCSISIPFLNSFESFPDVWIRKGAVKGWSPDCHYKGVRISWKKPYPSFLWCLHSSYLHSMWASRMYLKIAITTINPLSLFFFPACKWNSLICSKDFFLVGSKYLAVVLHSLSTVPLLHLEGERKMPFALFRRIQKATVLRVPSADSHVELNQQPSQSCAFITLLMHNRRCFGGFGVV